MDHLYRNPLTERLFFQNNTKIRAAVNQKNKDEFNS